MMTREELEAALAKILPRKAADPYPDRPAVLVGEPLEIVADAARKQLALMPEKCDMLTHDKDDPVCHGSGKVYPQETVEKIARIFYDSDVNAIDPGGPIVPWQRVLDEAPRSAWHIAAVAVLDALGEMES